MYRAAAEAAHAHPMLSLAPEDAPRTSVDGDLMVTTRWSRRARPIVKVGPALRALARDIGSYMIRCNVVCLQTVFALTLTIMLIALGTSDQPVCTGAHQPPVNASVDQPMAPAQPVCLDGCSYFTIWLTAAALLAMVNSAPPDLTLLAT